MEDPLACRVYVGNLPYSVGEDELKEFLSTSAEPLVIAFVLKNKGPARGSAIAHFATPEIAEKVIADLNATTLDGRVIAVRPDRGSVRVVPFGSFDRDDSMRSRFNRFTPAEEGTTVFFGNLPWSMAWQDLKDFARSAGPVVRADVPTGPHRRSKGYGTVVFETTEAANNAIETLNGQEVDGRTIEVRLDRPFSERVSENPSSAQKPPGRAPVRRPVHSSFASASGHGVPSDTIHVSNLPWQTTDSDLVDLFETVGMVSRAEIQRFPDGRPSGNGLVKFLSTSDANMAVGSFNGYRYGGQDLVVTYARYPPPLDSTESA